MVDTIYPHSSKYSPTRSLISREVASEVPNGFSITTRAGLALSLAFLTSFAASAKGAGRHRKIVNGGAVFIQHIAQRLKRRRIVHVKITKIQTAAQRIPQAFINFFLREGFQRLTHDVGMLFIPVRAPHPNDPGIRMIRRLSADTGRQFPARASRLRRNDQSHASGCLRYRHVISALTSRVL